MHANLRVSRTVATAYASVIASFPHDLLICRGLVVRLIWHSGHAGTAPTLLCLNLHPSVNLAQASIFNLFSQYLDAYVAVAKSRADYDDGIVNLKAQSIEVKSTELIHEEAGTGVPTLPCNPKRLTRSFL